MAHPWYTTEHSRLEFGSKECQAFGQASQKDYDQRDDQKEGKEGLKNQERAMDNAQDIVEEAR